MAEALAESARKTRVILNGPDLAAQIQRPCSGWMLSGTGIICKSQDHACKAELVEMQLWMARANPGQLATKPRLQIPAAA